MSGKVKTLNLAASISGFSTSANQTSGAQKTKIVKSTGEVIDSFGGAGGGSSVGGGNNTYSPMQGDFSVVANNGAKTVTITWASTAPFTLNATHVASGICKRIRDGAVSDVPLTKVSVTDLTITFGDAENFATGDIVVLVLIGPDKAYDRSGDTQKFSFSQVGVHKIGYWSVTGSYTIGQVMGIDSGSYKPILTMADCARVNGGQGILMQLSVSLRHQDDAVHDGTNQKFRIYVFDTLPTSVPADKQTFLYKNENIGKRLAEFDVSMNSNLAGTSQMTVCHLLNLNTMFTCAADSRALYFIIVPTVSTVALTSNVTIITLSARINQF